MASLKSKCVAPRELLKKEPVKSIKKEAELTIIVEALLRTYGLAALMGTAQDVIESNNKRKTLMRKRQIRALRVGAALMIPSNDDKRIFVIKPERPILFPPIG